MCRMRDGEECRGLELGWVLDTGDNMALAVNTETGWRKIMVSTVLQLHSYFLGKLLNNTTFLQCTILTKSCHGLWPTGLL